MKRFLRRAKKAVGALLGAATAASVAVVLNMAFGVDLPDPVDGAIATIAAYAGAWLAPKNEES